MDQLPFDPEDPPAQPPTGAHPLIWRLAYSLHAIHQPTAAGLCGVCYPRSIWPCPPSGLAAQGLTAACYRHPAAPYPHAQAYRRP